MLTALNLYEYEGEIAAMMWDKINDKSGEVVTRWPETGVSQVAILWPETLTALKEV